VWHVLQELIDAQMMQENLADLDCVDESAKWTALHYAVANHNAAMVKQLLDAGESMSWSCNFVLYGLFTRCLVALPHAQSNRRSSNCCMQVTVHALHFISCAVRAVSVLAPSHAHKGSRGPSSCCL
jgi:ankyrin repeat protein